MVQAERGFWERYSAFDVERSVAGLDPRAPALVIGQDCTADGLPGETTGQLAAALDRRGYHALSLSIAVRASAPEAPPVTVADLARLLGMRRDWALAVGVGWAASALLALARDLPGGASLVLVAPPISSDGSAGTDGGFSLDAAGGPVHRSFVDLAGAALPTRGPAAQGVQLERPLLVVALPEEERAGRSAGELLFELAPRPKTLIVLGGTALEPMDPRTRSLAGQLVAEWAEERLLEQRSGRAPVPRIERWVADG